MPEVKIVSKVSSDDREAFPPKRNGLAKKPVPKAKSPSNDKPSSSKSALPPSSDPRKVLYDKANVSLAISERGKALTAEQSKKLIGWHEETDTIKFDQANPHDLIDARSNKIQLLNNVRNRQIYKTVHETLKQEILRHRWQFNGETIIIGKTGLVLNGQHTLIALILAVQEWIDHPEFYPDWQEEPTIDKAIIFGIDECDLVVNTMDTCKPRSLADVIFRSEYFKDVRVGERKQLSRITDYAIRVLWHRTGATHDAFAPATRRTHAESLDFLARHPRVLECVKHIWAENGTTNQIGRTINPGAAAGMMYLMATARTERENDEKTGYTDVKSPTEELLDFSLFGKAGDFWVHLAKGTDVLLALRRSVGVFLEEGGAGLALRCALVAKAWNAYSAGEEVTEETLYLEFKDDDYGNPQLDETPIVGGIDIGRP